jgi:hypothetical protein
MHPATTMDPRGPLAPRQPRHSAARLLSAALAVLLLGASGAGVARAGDVNRASCPNELTSGFRSYLPDCRAYERVTPSYKGGFPVAIEGISESGQQLEARSLGIFSHPENTGQVGGIYETERTDAGWLSTPLDASSSLFASFSVETVSPDFSSSLWFARMPSQSVIPDVYLGVPPRGPFTRIGPSGSARSGEEVLHLVGASRDLSHSVYLVLPPYPGERGRLWPGDKTVGENSSLYEYAGTNNSEPSLVGVSNAGPVASVAASQLISECDTYLGGPGPYVGPLRRNAYNAVSESGAKVFFTALGRDYGECGGLGAGVAMPDTNEVYARVDASKADAHTVAISEPSKTDCGECSLSGKADAEYQGASLDGSEVFFTTTQHLLPGAVGAGADLYRYDFNGPAEGRVTLLSAGDPAGADVQRVVRVSDDGSHVYFLARGALTSEPNSFGRHPEAGQESLYVYERDAAHPLGHVAFIGTGSVGSAQATPDGRFLVFESAADLTPDQEGHVEAGQVFEYDAQTGGLIRVSRGQGGYNDDGHSSVYPATIPRSNFKLDWPIKRFTGLAMSADGADVFFTSEDSLTLQALSGGANVYEYHEGQVALISGGHDQVSVYNEPAVHLLGTSESGEDVFFETADQLVAEDTDTQLDVYDARIEGGFPAPAAKPSCSEDACRGPLAAGLQTPAPSSFSAVGESAIAPGSGAPATSKPVVRRKAKKKHHRRHRRKHRHRARRAAGGRKK